MNDELQGVLAELASGLGTTTGELWTWLQGDGIEAYAAAKVAQLWVVVVAAGIVAVTCVAMVWVFIDRYRKGNRSDWDADDAFVGSIISLAILAFDVVFSLSYASELAGWLTSPQGMAISMLLDKLGG